MVPYAFTTPLFLLGVTKTVTFTDPLFPFDWYIGKTMLSLSIFTYLSIAVERYVPSSCSFTPFAMKLVFVKHNITELCCTLELLIL